MKPILKKLNALLATDYNHLTQNDVCNHFGWTRPYLSKILREREYASDKQIKRIITELPNVSKPKPQEIAA